MIDTGRNFITTTKIREQIDAMSLCKMNSLHWHLVDAQSWPVEIKKYDMTKDAYSARETYSQEDIKSIVSYGKDRGVRIIPEIDMPGHARSGWQQVDPNIVACLEVYWNDAAVEPCPGQLEILDNNTYPIIKDVYNEVSPLFIDDVFHVGGDELQQKCYSYSEKVVKWYAQDSLRTIHDLFQVFFDKTQPIFRNTPTRKLTMWEDVIETTYANKVPKDIILQSWNGQENIGDLTKKGYDVIVSSAMWFYLDCGHGGFLTNDPSYIEAPQNHGVNYQTGSSWCNPYKTWQRIYDYDFLHGLNQDQKSHVIGAEVCLWAEQSDSSDITQKIWPRAAALAESTWSGNKDSNGHYRTNLATQRILNFREYLVALEIPATPLVPKYCIQNPHACDFSQNQTIMDSYA